ncbi:hypothetical protein L5F39_00345 [Aliarcobacter butzleri]|uniref:hypothetical protein n=1 Tax=Aliarcobacter butzleri TaxID=28197 RepID=UPI001EE096F8|nr:hypothetical protein [Aliarcobacter butzleri]MCG3696044.1 hypothetical protein [Aliarcobacter butzleri]
MNSQNQHPLQLALEELKTMPTIDIDGKSYTTVANRINIFRKYFSDYSIVTNILNDDEIKVVVQTKITTPSGVVIATGLAEEFRGKNIINTTSALENAETSSIGRALACLSLGGSEYASANEVENAISQQEQIKQNNNQRTTNQQSYQPQRQTQNQYQHQKDFSTLINAGLQVIDLGDILTVSGDGIFEKKNIIKNSGFKWNAQNKQWYLPKRQVA